MSAYERLAAAVLVAHQRHNASSCLCGWSVLGASHAEHVASELADAGVFGAPFADRLVHAAGRIDWSHVVNGLDLRDDSLAAYDQHGRRAANRDTAAAVSDFLAVLREFGIAGVPA